MRKLFLSILLILPVLAFCEEEIVVTLPTENQLIPISIKKFEGDNSNYEKSLEEIFRFDLNFNGMTTLAPEGLYEISVSIKENRLNASLRSDDGDFVREVKGIQLTGKLSKDRKTIHHLSDTIHKELFGVEGIASCRFLYTLRDGENAEVWEADYDGKNERQITHGEQYCVTPYYVPPKPGNAPGSFFYVSYKTGQPKIYIASLKDGKGQRISYLGGNQLMPTINRQRDLVSFISDYNGNPDLYTLPFDPQEGPLGKPRLIYTTYYSTQGTPTFSPDGSKVAFVSNKDGSPRIYVMNIPTPNMSMKQVKTVLISKMNRESTAPQWSPDGTKIVYCAKTNGVRQIWVYDFNKNREKQLTHGSINKENPTWAPDSLHIIFNTTGKNQGNLYLINLKQTEAVKISSGPGEKRFPSFAPR